MWGLVRALTRRLSTLGLSVLLAGDPIAAQPLLFGWRAPPGCPERDQVQARIAELAGRLLEQSPDDLEFEATVERLEGGDLRLQVVLDARGERRTRTIVGESCGALSEAAAVVVVLALREAQQPQATSEAKSPSPLQTAAPEPSPGPPERSATAAQAPASEPRPRPLPRLLARAELGVDMSVFPEPAAIVSAGVGVAVSPSVRIETYTLVTIPEDVQQPALVRLSLVGQGGRGCLVTRTTGLGMSACAAVEVGILRGHSREAGLEPALASALWAAPGLRLGLEVSLVGPVLLGVAGEWLAVLQKHEVVLDRPENRDVHVLPGHTQRGFVTLGIELP